jgi:hypothetical protein
MGIHRDVILFNTLEPIIVSDLPLQFRTLTMSEKGEEN